MKLHTEHEPYSIDLLNYEIAVAVTSKPKLSPTRFSGKRVRQSSSKLKQIRQRDRRLREIGASVMCFAS